MATGTKPRQRRPSSGDQAATGPTTAIDCNLKDARICWRFRHLSLAHGAPVHICRPSPRASTRCLRLSRDATGVMAGIIDLHRTRLRAAPATSPTGPAPRRALRVGDRQRAPLLDRHRRSPDTTPAVAVIALRPGAPARRHRWQTRSPGMAAARFAIDTHRVHRYCRSAWRSSPLLLEAARLVLESSSRVPDATLASEPAMPLVSFCIDDPTHPPQRRRRPPIDLSRPHPQAFKHMQRLLPETGVTRTQIHTPNGH